MSDLVLQEAKRLHDLGFAIHWLHNKSKRPIEKRLDYRPASDLGLFNEKLPEGFERWSATRYPKCHTKKLPRRT